MSSRSSVALRLRPNDPPAIVLHEVKDAVAVVKKGAEGWTLATSKAGRDLNAVCVCPNLFALCNRLLVASTILFAKEMAAIDLMKTRQQAFFQFVISGISGGYRL